MDKKIAKCRIYNEQKDSFIIDYKFSIELESNKVLEEIISEKIPVNLLCSDEVYNLIDEAVEQYAPVPLGVFNIYEIMDQIYATAKTYIREKLQECIFYIEEIDEHGNVVSVQQIDLVNIIIDLIEERSISEQSNCDAGGYVEQSLKLFEEKSTWNVGLKIQDGVCIDANRWPAPEIENDTVVWKKESKYLSPVMWFGPSGEIPLEQWTINSSDNNSQFWFANDADQELEFLISEPDDAFLCWYNWECVMQFPVLEDILKRCPVSISAEDTDEIILKKINEYMLHIYKKVVG